MRILSHRSICLPPCAGWLLLFFILFLIGANALYAQNDAQSGGEGKGLDVVMAHSALPTFVSGEIIVKMKENAVTALSQEAMAQWGLESTSRRTSGGETILKFTPEAMHKLRSLSEQESEDQTLAIVRELQANPNVEYAQPNWLLHPFKTPNDPLYPKQWH
jgi:hypothetical protein